MLKSLGVIAMHIHLPFCHLAADMLTLLLHRQDVVGDFADAAFKLNGGGCDLSDAINTRASLISSAALHLTSRGRAARRGDDAAFGEDQIWIPHNFGGRQKIMEHD